MCDTTGITSVSLRNPDLSPISTKEDSHNSPSHNLNILHSPSSKLTKHSNNNNIGNDVVQHTTKQNQVGSVMLFGVPIVSLVMDGKERLCLAQISSTLLKDFSYNEIHNRRVALGITCVQCTPVQLEILRRAGAMPVTSRRCGMITRREAERLCQSFLGDHAPPQLPENFAFEVYHHCGWGSRGSFVPSRYNSSRAKCIRCTYCQLFFSPNKFIFHSHRLPESRYVQPDAANFNSWRRHLKLCGDPPDEDLSSTTLSMDTAQIVHAWEDVRAMFNGGTRKRMLAAHSHHSRHSDNHRRLSNLAHGIKGPSNNSNGNSNANGSHRSGSGTPHQQNRHSSHHNHQNNSQNQNTHGINSGNNSQLINTGFNPDNPRTITNSSPNSFLTSPSPLLSPSTRLDTIWNPGLTATATANINNNPSRQCLGAPTGSSPMPHLPFHPLSIPWLRRPLFPFPHPFAPAAVCHLLGDPGMGAPVPEKLAAGITARQNQSAFKPVSRNAEHLFTWLSNNNTSMNNAGGIICPGSSLPEDLSLNSTIHSVNGTNINNNIVTKQSEAGSTQQQPNNTDERQPQCHSSVSSTNDDDNDTDNKGSSSPCRPSRRHGNLLRHQIQILSSANENETDDDENVDIESTEVEECSSTSSNIWVTSGSRSGHTGHHHLSSSHHSHNQRKRSRSKSPSLSSSPSESCSGGEDETISMSSSTRSMITTKGESSDSPNKNNIIIMEKPAVVRVLEGKSLKKRKKLWDFDTSRGESVKKAANEMSHNTSPLRQEDRLHSKE